MICTVIELWRYKINGIFVLIIGVLEVQEYIDICVIFVFWLFFFFCDHFFKECQNGSCSADMKFSQGAWLLVIPCCSLKEPGGIIRSNILPNVRKWFSVGYYLMRDISAAKGLIGALSVWLAGCFSTPLMLENQNSFYVLPGLWVDRVVLLKSIRKLLLFSFQNHLLTGGLGKKTTKTDTFKKYFF